MTASSRNDLTEQSKLRYAALTTTTTNNSRVVMEGFNAHAAAEKE